MGSLLGDTSLVEDVDPVGVQDARDALRAYQGGGVACGCPELGEYFFLRLRVDGG